MAAYGTGAAIAQQIGGKKSKALSAFADSVRVPADGSSPKARRGSQDMGELRRRVSILIAQGEM